MPEATRDFWFSDGLQGWEGVVGDTDGGAVVFAQRVSAHHHGRTGFLQPPLSKLIGHLQFSAYRNTFSAAHHIRLNTTWADLGVPAGSDVTRCKISFLARWDLRNGRRNCQAEWSSVSTGVGPATVSTEDNATVIATLAAVAYAPARTPGSHWEKYPDNNTGLLNLDNPDGWLKVAGVYQNVAAAYKNRLTRLLFKINVTTPGLSAAAWHFCNVKLNGVVITTEYTTGAEIIYNPLANQLP